MHDTLAFVRLALVRNMLPVAVLIAWSVATAAVCLIVHRWFPQSGAALPVLVIGTLPAWTWSLGLFDYGGAKADLGSGETGLNRFLLRMPVAAWKIAIVPIVLRSVWIVVAWMLFAAFAEHVSGRAFPTWRIASLLAAASVWAQFLVWRPFRNGWWRIGILLLISIGMLGLFIVAMMIHFKDPKVGWHLVPPVPQLTSVCGPLLFGAGVAFVIRSVSLARTNGQGMLPEFAWGQRGRDISRDEASHSTGDGESEDVAETKGHGSRALPERLFQSPSNALIWHDLRRMFATERRWSFVLFFCYILVITLLLPFSPMTLVFVAMFACYMGLMYSINMLEAVKSRQAALPPYLAVAPMSNAELGFTRLKTIVVFSIVNAGILLAIFLCVGWLVWDFTSFENWIANTNKHYNSNTAAIRWICVSVLFCLAFTPTRAASFTWPSLAGRMRLQLAVVAAPWLLLIAGGGVVCYWFLQQTDLESAVANAWRWSEYLTPILAALVTAKCVSVCATIFLIRREDLLSSAAILKFAIAWFFATVVLVVAFAMLIPEPRFALAWTVLGGVLMVPLARILIVPYAVFINRHR